MRLLRVCDRSTSELRDRLHRSGYQPVVVEAVLERALDSGLLHDADFAQRLVERRLAEHRGVVGIHQELLQKGIAAEIIETVLDRVLAGYDEDAAASSS